MNLRILWINVKIYHTLCLTYSSSLRCSINKEMLNYAKLRKHIVFSLALLYHPNGVATDTSHEHLLTDLDTCSSTSIFPRLPQIHHKSFSCRAFRLCLSKWHLTKSYFFVPCDSGHVSNISRLKFLFFPQFHLSHVTVSLISKSNGNQCFCFRQVIYGLLLSKSNFALKF